MNHVTPQQLARLNATALLQDAQSRLVVARRCILESGMAPTDVAGKIQCLVSDIDEIQHIVRLPPGVG